MKFPRWTLWALLCALLATLLGVLVFLARAYEDGREEAVLDEQADHLAREIRSGLLRNVQTVQSLQTGQVSPSAWEVMAAEVLGQNREMVRLEWRDPQFGLRAARNSPFQPALLAQLPREQALADVRQACASARRLSGPFYSASYFWPIGQGLGLELMELCVPVAQSGRDAGFLLVTYSLQGLLSELVPSADRRGRRLSLTQADGTRLAMLGEPSGAGRTTHAQSLLDVPGTAFMLRMEVPQRPRLWFPNVLTGVVAMLVLALVAVLVLLARDTRRRLKAERGLAEALAFRKAMENSLITGLRARDMAGRITYVNPAFCDMVGLPAERLLGQGPPAPYWPPERVDEYRQRLAERLTGQPLPREGVESEFMRVDGVRFPVLIIEAPLVNAEGEQTGWMSAVLDLTAQRRVEALSRATQERLQASARLAMLGEMASLISHELNQPLAAIASYASGTLNLLDEDPPTPGAAPAHRDDLRLAMRRIAEQAERAGKVIRSVGDLVRQRQGEREAVHPQALLDAVLPLLQLQVHKAGIRLAVEVAPDTPAVWCDRTMVEQVLLNLGRNAAQAMPADDPPAVSGLRWLGLQVFPERSTGGAAERVSSVRFEVTDHGPGLSDEVAARLFTPFFTTKSDGMGLGLGLCRTVIEQHGGALTHRPAVPRGTVFSFTLPTMMAEPHGPP